MSPCALLFELGTDQGLPYEAYRPPPGLEWRLAVSLANVGNVELISCLSYDPWSVATQSISSSDGLSGRIHTIYNAKILTNVLKHRSLLSTISPRSLARSTRANFLRFDRHALPTNSVSIYTFCISFHMLLSEFAKFGLTSQLLQTFPMVFSWSLSHAFVWSILFRMFFKLFRWYLYCELTCKANAFKLSFWYIFLLFTLWNRFSIRNTMFSSSPSDDTYCCSPCRIAFSILLAMSGTYYSYSFVYSQRKVCMQNED